MKGLIDPPFLPLSIPEKYSGESPHYLTKECRGLMNPYNNPIQKYNYLTKECKGLTNPKLFRNLK